MDFFNREMPESLPSLNAGNIPAGAGVFKQPVEGVLSVKGI